MRGTDVTVVLPDLGRPLDETTREERAAIAMLLIEQNRVELPKPLEGETNSLAA